MFGVEVTSETMLINNGVYTLKEAKMFQDRIMLNPQDEIGRLPSIWSGRFVH